MSGLSHLAGAISDEPIDSYLTALRELAKSCDFGTLEEEMIRDQIVEKCASKSLRQKLLQQDDLDLTKTMKVARSDESSKKDASVIAKGTRDDPITIDQNQKKFVCYRCGGGDGHTPSECGAVRAKCSSCQKKGHLARVCKSKPKRDDNSEPNRRNQKKSCKKSHKKVRNVTTGWLSEPNSSDDEDEHIFSMNNSDSSIQVKLNDQKIRMIVDTGSKFNIISSQLYKSQFKRYELRETRKRFIAYGQKEPLDCKGYFTATLKVGRKEIVGNIYVIEGHSDSLLGKDSSSKLEILKQVNTVGHNSPKSNVNSELDALIQEYDQIFHGIGKVTNFEHKISIDHNVKPVSQPAQTYTL